MNFKYLTLSMFMCLGLFTSCGYQETDTHYKPTPQEEQAQDFSTRLSDKLLIAGTKCNGNETTEYGGQTYNCKLGEWLITIDNVNSCTPQGACTEVGIIPIVGELDLADIVSIPELSYFKIDAKTPVTSEQQTILNNVYVRFNTNGETKVINRSDI